MLSILMKIFTKYLYIYPIFIQAIHMKIMYFSCEFTTNQEGKKRRLFL
jgi:hypothetical protein